MMVGSMVEAAAEEIGANPLLGKVMCYYHDIGKMKKPQYFIENQKGGENPHDKLSPSMSALIIEAHVKDGIEMAKKARLPREIISFIPEHHGTSTMAFFYHKALADLSPNQRKRIHKKDFMYPGPKPQRKETAIVMIADSVEAASRSLDEITF
jgi:putative nucleotidyltransferase with HDIG domain